MGQFPRYICGDSHNKTTHFHMRFHYVLTNIWSYSSIFIKKQGGGAKMKNISKNVSKLHHKLSDATHKSYFNLKTVICNVWTPHTHENDRKRQDSSLLKRICVHTCTFIIKIKGSWQIFVNPLHLNIKIQLISCTTVSFGIMTARYIWIERSNTEVIKNKKFNISTTIF